MKLEGYTGAFHRESQLEQAVRDLSEEGFRIVAVLDRSTPHNDRFLVVAQREPEVRVAYTPDPEAERKLEALQDITKLERQNPPIDHYAAEMKLLAIKYGKVDFYELKRWAKGS